MQPFVNIGDDAAVDGEVCGLAKQGDPDRQPFATANLRMEEGFDDGQKSVCIIQKLGLDPLLPLDVVFARYKAQSISSKQGCGFIKCKQPLSREACKKLAACLF